MSAEMTPGERLARAMMNAGYVNRDGGPNVYKLARALGGSDHKSRDSWDRQLRAWLKGDHMIGAGNAERVAPLLEVSPEELRVSRQLPTREAVLLADRLEELVDRAERLALRLEADLSVR